ncbi:MAG: hypothetical protein HY562_11885 [Ignavibacteriales bacterium]|nr:hypothetical protein [Ignavibacteriales bacterium]
MKPPKGVQGLDFEGVFFTEQEISKYSTVRHIEVVIKRQNATLDDLKRRMANEAKAAGANAIKNFRYGQRIMSALKALIRFQWEIEYWHGEGDAVKM